MIKIIYFTISLLAPIASLAISQTPIVQAMDSVESNYYSFIEMNSKKYISYSDFYVSSLYSKSINYKIRDLFLIAKNYYYEKKFYKAKIKYLEIVGLYNKYHLNDHGKNIVLQSLTKLIELSDNIDDQLRFKKLVDNGAFPPVSIKEGKNIWTVPDHFSDFKKILINGQSYNLYKGLKINLPIERFFVTLVSNRFKPISLQLDSYELNEWRPTLTWLAKYDCEYNRNNKTINSYAIYFKDNCITQPTKNNFSLHQLKPNESNNPLTTSTGFQKPKAWYKNKWVWAGFGVLTTAVVISTKNKNNSQKNKQPTTKRGF